MNLSPVARGDQHAETQRLLPWYVTGRLEPAAQVRVEAHLAACATCQADLALERRLRDAAPPPTASVDAGWAALSPRLQPRPARSWFVDLRRRAHAWAEDFAPRPRMLGWVAAAQTAALAILLVVAFRAAPAPAPKVYHTLGSPAVAVRGDVIVKFRPEMSIGELARLLERSDARVVDGPTDADAYVLDVDPARREAALKVLRAEPKVTLAEPIDAPP